MDQGGICPQGFPALTVAFLNNTLWPLSCALLTVSFALGCLFCYTIITVSKDWTGMVVKLSTEWGPRATQWGADMKSISAQWASALPRAAAGLFSEATRNLACGMKNAFGAGARHFGDAVFGLLRMEDAVAGLYAWQNQAVRRRLGGF